MGIFDGIKEAADALKKNNTDKENKSKLGEHGHHRPEPPKDKDGNPIAPPKDKDGNPLPPPGRDGKGPHSFGGHGNNEENRRPEPPKDENGNPIFPPKDREGKSFEPPKDKDGNQIRPPFHRENKE